VWLVDWERERVLCESVFYHNLFLLLVMGKIFAYIDWLFYSHIRKLKRKYVFVIQQILGMYLMNSDAGEHFLGKLSISRGYGSKSKVIKIS
jgi:hypothetical protein